MPLFDLGFKSILGFTVFAAAALGGVASCETGDPSCEAGADLANTDDACPYGPPAALERPARDCPDVDFSEAADVDCATWADVWQIFRDEDRGRCSIDSCHGGPAAAARAFGIWMPADDPDIAYESLASYRDAAGAPYLGEDDPTAWILCNLQGLPGGGKAMPKDDGLLSECGGVFDVDVVKRWVVCGMRNDGFDVEPPPPTSSTGAETSSSGEGAESSTSSCGAPIPEVGSSSGPFPEGVGGAFPDGAGGVGGAFPDGAGGVGGVGGA